MDDAPSAELVPDTPSFTIVWGSPLEAARRLLNIGS